MALSICLMQPWKTIDPKAPFAAAFLAAIPVHADPKSLVRLFYETSARFVSFGAVTGEHSVSTAQTTMCDSQ